MYNTHLFYCFMVVSGRLVLSQNGCDLKLDQIFRTPQDFSKVNFDHFEIVERNNFETTPTPPTTPQNDVGPNTIDHPHKSVANAQVMLRFGGDNMHNCRGISISPASRSKFIERSHNSDDVRPICPRTPPLVTTPPIYTYNEYGYPVYPTYLTSPQIAPQCSYSYPQSPYNFPGYYYGVRHLPTYISNPYGLYNGQLIPTEAIIGPNEAFIPSQNTPEERNAFLEYRKALVTTAFAENLRRVQENPSEEKLLRRNIQNAANVYDNIYLTNQGQPLIEEAVIETTADTPIIAISKPEMYLTNHLRPIVEETLVESTAETPILANSQPVVEETIEETTVDTPIIAISRPAVVKITNIDASSTPNSYPRRTSYEEVNPTGLPKGDIIALLDQALVPLTCQKCQQKRKLLVTYPIARNGRNVATDYETIEVPQCPCCTEQGSCGCCNRERNSSIPYGKRFPADLDSLLEIAPTISVPPISTPGPKKDQTVFPYQEPVIPLPPSYILNQVDNGPTVPPRQQLFTPSVINQVLNVPLVYGGYKRTSESYFSTGIPNCEKPEPYVKGIQTSGSGYYSDPIKSVYTEPTVTNVRVENPIEENIKKEDIEPQLYQVIPKNDIGSKGGIKSLNIPDLVPTNRYICANCNKLTPRIVCHREFVPVEGKTAVAKETPHVVNYGSKYCPNCAKYMGELNEVSSRE